jgi:ABC-2 type transport system ATP-binding protein
VTLDRGPEEAQPLLTGLTPIAGCSHLGSGARHHRYALDTADPEAAAPLVARCVSECGWPLYGLTPETRDLETLFGEVNATGEASHG